MRYDSALVPDVRALRSAAAGLTAIAGLPRTPVTLGALARYPALAIVAHSMGGLVA